MNQNAIFVLIARELDLHTEQIKNTVNLLDKDNTVPFIARYRKEVTGNLNEEQIHNIEDRISYLRKLEDRKNTVKKSIQEQGKLTPELKKKIDDASSFQEVEDLYLPYKPKKRTRATVAKSRGLEPLAQIILEQKTCTGDPRDIASRYINKGKEVETAEQALQGARDIIAEIISVDPEIKKTIRQFTSKNGCINSQSADEGAKKEYEVYLDYSEPVKSIPPHRILALNRGEKEKMLRVSIEISSQDSIALIEKKYICNDTSIFTDELKTAVQDSYTRLIAPAIEREIRKKLTERAEEHAIEIFTENLRSLLMTPPVKGKKILGIDPGFRTGCKIAAIDETGKYLAGATIYPHPPQKKWEQAKKSIHSFIKEHNLDIIAIGNGTASRETEKLVAELLSDLDEDIHYTIVSEAGASVYSASQTAREEFPDLEAALRGNISIARRVLDPLSELVKIDPKSVGVGLYQHDVNQKKLSRALDRVVESCVNQVGINLNTASSSLLKYAAGINASAAENIIQYREKKGIIRNRKELKNIKGIGENTFTQCAGFLRIPDSDNFLDATAVHPESYESTLKMLDYFKLNLTDVKSDGTLINSLIKDKKIPLQELSREIGTGYETLIDIIGCLEKPNRDPRDKMDPIVLKADILTLNDLKPGMILKGTVRNVVDFGAFVDIGVKQDGLVHISNMANRYIKHPLDIVSVGNVVKVKVIDIDKDRERISLSMII
ncbi:MAG: Tex family protein [bacterium]